MLDELLHHHKSPYAVLLDIGSGSVGVAIIEEDPLEEKPLIIYTHRERIRVTQKRDPDEFIRILKEALLAVTLELASSGMRALKEHDPHARVYRRLVLYASPWSEAITRIIALEHEEPFMVTEQFVEKLIQDALEKAESSTHEKQIFEETGKTVIKRSIIASYINGYLIDHFTGQTATELKIAYMTELVPEIARTALNSIEKNIASHTHEEERTFIVAAYHAAHALFPHLQNTFIIDVTGEATECGVVEHGVLSENFSTTFGSQSVVRLIAQKLGTLEDEARSHIRDYEAQMIHTDAKDTITLVRETYKEELRRLLTNIQSAYLVPEHFVLVLNPETAAFFSTMIEEVVATLRGEYGIHLLDEQAVKSLVMYTDACRHDHYIAIGAAFFHNETRAAQNK